jgi:2-polyprenyl-3-methyl-5-hydroxy-6-metoxy-1,4-benzoquinol methylase
MKKTAVASADREINHGQKIARQDPEKIWGWKTPAGRLRAQRRAAMIADSAGLAPGMRVLVIGCGSGLFTEMFSKSGAQLLAVDISGDLLAQAKQRRLPEKQVRFLEKRFEDCEVEGPFDAVIGSSVLHHLDLKQALAKIHQLLKKGGVMSFTEPNMLNPQIMAQKNIPWLKERMGDSPDETAFIRWSMHRILKQSGFHHIRITPFDWLHPAVPAALVGIVASAGAILERVPVIREFAGSLHIVGFK